MSFPYHDNHWSAVAKFLKSHVKVEDKILAQDIFWWLFKKIYRYEHLKNNPNFQYDWTVIHKGEIDMLPSKNLAKLVQSMRAVFANEVFVVLTKRFDLPELNPKLNHVYALTKLIEAKLETDEAPQVVAESIFPDPTSIVQFNSFDSAKLREVMNHFWLNGGYIYYTPRDKTYYNEIDRNISAMISSSSARRKILDICCGIGRLKTILKHDQIVGVEISDVAVNIARERHMGLENFTFQQGDAEQLCFHDETFDVVLFIDSIEHVLNAQRALTEAARVLRKQGLLMVTVANRDSLNQLITRKLGHPEFVTNYQHIREFSYQESIDLLTTAGFKIVKTSGIFLYPYWGVPGIDHLVKHITDNDAEVVKIMQILGEKVGAEYAYTSVILAEKQ